MRLNFSSRFRFFAPHTFQELGTENRPPTPPNLDKVQQEDAP